MRNTEEAVARGVFGIPTFFVGNEIFFGKDRLARRGGGDPAASAANRTRTLTFAMDGAVWAAILRAARDHIKARIRAESGRSRIHPAV